MIITGQTIANAATQAITINNSSITTSTALSFTLCTVDASANGAYLTVEGNVIATGSIVVNVSNNSGADLAATDNIVMSLIVLG